MSSLLAAFLEGLSKLLNQKPVIEQRHCEISKNYSWLGQTAAQALIPALAARFAGMNDPAEQTKLALAFAVSLLGGRSQEGRARQALRTVEHMKSLYLLMARYIREKEDTQRAGKGVYSPGLRDDAQDARNALIEFIRETPGKPAFLALLEMAHAHPDA